MAALKDIGVYSVNQLDVNSVDKIKNWLDSTPIQIKFENNVAELLDKKIIKN